MHAFHPCLLTAVGILTSAGVSAAADWPQLFGPRRDATSTEKGLVSSWEEKGPPLLWHKPVGEGYSGPVVVGDKLIVFHRQRLADNEVVECWNAKTGKEIWKYSYPCGYEDDFNKGNGPRSTPVIADGKVFTLGAEGTLHCLDLANGKKLWSRSITKDYNVPRSFFGVGSSPIVEGDLLLVNVGARNAGIVAFHKDTGKEAWKATSDGASYASPVVATVAGSRAAIFFTRQGVVLLDPRDGAVRYQKRWRARIEASVNAATPVVVKDLVFFSASYDTGALLLRVSKKGVEEVWSGEESLSCHYNTPVHHDGYLYGIDGRQETGASLRCVELKTGKVQWTKEGFGCASILLAEGRLIAMTERGDLVLLEATPREYREKARAAVLAAMPVRSEIALANGRLYARDQRKLGCWDLRK
jgi:outer membrane protein assembly factor BamB